MHAGGPIFVPIFTVLAGFSAPRYPSRCLQPCRVALSGLLMFLCLRKPLSTAAPPAVWVAQGRLLRRLLLLWRRRESSNGTQPSDDHGRRHRRCGALAPQVSHTCLVLEFKSRHWPISCRHK